MNRKVRSSEPQECAGSHHGVIRAPSPAGAPPADPNFVETSSGGAELALAITPGDGKVTLSTMEARLPLDALEAMLELGSAGAKQVFELMRGSLRDYAAARLKSRGLLGDA